MLQFAGRDVPPRFERADDDMRQVVILEDKIKSYGGPVSEATLDWLRVVQDAKQAVLRQIGDFQDRLARRYWIIRDGRLLYGGWHSVNVPGWNVHQAVLEQKYADPKPELAPERWKKRKYAWRFQPPQLTEIAFEYFRVKQETDTWDARQFSSNPGRIDFDPSAWSRFRVSFLNELMDALGRDLRDIDTSEYAVQVWAESYNFVLRMYRDVVALTLAWEHFIRTETGDERSEDVMNEWKREFADNPVIYLGVEIKTPGVVHKSFNENSAALSERVGIHQFASRWRNAVEVNEIPPGVDD